MTKSLPNWSHSQITPPLLYRSAFWKEGILNLPFPPLETAICRHTVSNGFLRHMFSPRPGSLLPLLSVQLLGMCLSCQVRHKASQDLPPG